MFADMSPVSQEAVLGLYCLNEFAVSVSGAACANRGVHVGGSGGKLVANWLKTVANQFMKLS